MLLKLSTVLRDCDWDVAVSLYERAVGNHDGDDEGGYDALIDTPSYTLRARQAAMLLQGGHGLLADPSRAGEGATVANERMIKEYFRQVHRQEHWLLH